MTSNIRVHQPKSSGCKLDGTILISVDDIEGGQQGVDFGHVSEPIRAQSLNRLDTVTLGRFNSLSAAAASGYIYKCPSFPRLARDSSLSARTISTTHLETESLSPRVSSATLSQDFDNELLGLSLGVLTVPLTRSTSARAIEVARSPTGVGGEFLSTAIDKTPSAESRNFLTPNDAAGKLSKKVCRSTSCPSMENNKHRRLPGGGDGGDQTRRNQTNHPHVHPLDRDVNLEGEEVKDLPVEPSKYFPDFLPELVEERFRLQAVIESPVTLHNTGDWPTAFFNEPPIEPRSPQQYLSKTTNNVFAAIGALHVGPKSKDRSVRHLGNDAVHDYVNIGDIPSSLAQQVINCDHRTNNNSYSRQRAPHLVQIKCLQWLNSLDSGQ